MLRKSTLTLQLDAPTPVADVADDNAFSALNLAPELVRAVATLGFTEPTGIQKEAIPPFLAGRDLLGQAATGTGKTAAFALPMLQRLRENTAGASGVRGFVLVPTRELAVQVSAAMQAYGRALGLRIVAIYGGQAMLPQLRALERGVDVVVATPGRALDHLRRNTLKLNAVEIVVLDEADEMLDMGFAEELETLLSALPKERQTALFSATMPRRILTITQRHLHNPVRIAIAAEPQAPGSEARVKEYAYAVTRRQRIVALARVLDVEAASSTIIFCATRVEVDEVAAALNERGLKAEALHGGLSQEQRDRVLKRFRDRSSVVLIATDVAARGLDIDHISHVVNLGVPTSPEVYVHRIGRTGRAGREGVAITIIDPRDQRHLRMIERITKRPITTRLVPTPQELRERRFTALATTLDEMLGAAEGGATPVSEPYTQLAQRLSEHHDPLAIAAAALQLFDQSRSVGADADMVIAQEAPAQVHTSQGHVRAVAAPKGPHPVLIDPVVLYIGVGRQDGVRPGDLVGAITNRAHIEGRSIGAITLADRFMLVDVPGALAESILEALRGALIRGKKVNARLDRGGDRVKPHGGPRRPSTHPKQTTV